MFEGDGLGEVVLMIKITTKRTVDGRHPANHLGYLKL